MKLYLKAGLFSLGLLVACSGSDQNKRRFTGLVEGTQIQIPALTGGKIEFLSFDTGDKIEEGQFLALVDTMALTLQLDQLSGSMAEIEAQEKLANTNLKKTQNDLQYIQEKYNRFLKLWTSKSVNQQTVDDVENRFKAAQMVAQAARQQFDTIFAKKKQIVASIMLVKKKINDSVIIAPISGIISEKYYDTGEAIPPFNPLAEIIDLAEVWVKIYVSETFLPEIKHGQEVTVRLDGIQKSLTGHISWISPKAEFTPKTILTPDTRTSLVYAVKILIPNQEQLLKHGMPVEIII